jgi:hypothetical protein
MQLLLGIIYLALIAAWLLLLVEHTCVRVPAFRRWRQVMRLSALLWLAISVLKKLYIDSLFPPGDAVLHDAIARDIAELLNAGQFTEAFEYFGFGNPAYRFVVGVFYALTAAPEVVVYAINGGLAFWGMLALLEAICKHSECSRLPGSVVVPCLFLPSSFLWATSNLKEGVVLWGICMMFSWTLPRQKLHMKMPRKLPVVGMLAVGLVRPHIALIWIVTINLLATWRARKIGLFIATGVGALVCVFFLKQAAPALFEAATGEGIASTLGGRYEHLTTSGNLASSHFLDKSPTPVWTGLMLILFRPWPWEVRQVGELLAGVEVWALASLGVFAWIRVPRKLEALKHPSAISLLVCLVLFGFFFTYMYNMGLVVRQRLMAFPAVWFLYSWPTVLALSPKKTVSSSSGSRRASSGCNILAGERRPLARYQGA